MAPRPVHIAAPSSANARRTLVIAEIGVNHGGNPNTAIDLIEAAAAAGADAVKFQLFNPGRLLSNQSRLASYQKGKAADPVTLLSELVLPANVLTEAAHVAHAKNLSFIVTPFSPDDVAELVRLDVDAVKIASPDAVNPPLLRAAASTAKPMIVSTGTCTLDEISPAADLLKLHAPGGALLHCVSSYPTPDGSASLGGITALREKFGLPIGYSDHTSSVQAAALAVAVGACVIEKHITLDRAAVGPDHAASADPTMFAETVRRIREAERMIGLPTKTVTEIEHDVRLVSRQSVCALRNLPAGHRLTVEDVTVKRPGSGIPAADFEAVIGRVLARPVAANDLLKSDDLA